MGLCWLLSCSSLMFACLFVGWFVGWLFVPVNGWLVVGWLWLVDCLLDWGLQQLIHLFFDWLFV